MIRPIFFLLNLELWNPLGVSVTTKATVTSEISGKILKSNHGPFKGFAEHRFFRLSIKKAFISKYTPIN